MKLQNKKKKVTTIVLIVVLAVFVVIGIIAGVIYALNAEIINYIIDVNLNKDKLTGIHMFTLPERIEYYVGDEFDPTGTKIQVLANSNEASYYVDYTDSELRLSGFDSTTPGEKTIEVTYKGFKTSFTVTVVEKEENPPSKSPVLTSIKISDNFVTTYDRLEWNFYGPSLEGVTLICTYDDGSQIEIPMIYDYFEDLSLSLKTAGDYEFTLKYNGITAKITITVTN